MRMNRKHADTIVFSEYVRTESRKSARKNILKKMGMNKQPYWF